MFISKRFILPYSIRENESFGDKQLLNSKIMIKDQELSDKLFQPSSAGECKVVTGQWSGYISDREAQLGDEVTCDMK